MNRQIKVYESIKIAFRPLIYLLDYFRSGKAKKKLSVRLVTNKIKPSELSSPIFIVATIGNLHIVDLCLKFIPAEQDCVVILNGLEAWERDWALQNLQSKGFIIFPFLIDHSMVIDYLLNWMKKPFGLLDEDCYVLDQSCFKEIAEITEKTVVSSFYSYTNSELDLTFPETMFLYLNTPVINDIKYRYGINSSAITWSNLSSKAKQKINSLGINENTLPEDYKPYFDTLRAIMALGLAENYSFYFPDGDHSLKSDRMVHIGAVASFSLRGLRLHKWDAARAAYFWYKVLESFWDAKLKSTYYAKYGQRNSTEILKQIPDNISEMFARNEFISSVEKIITQGQLPTKGS